MEVVTDRERSANASDAWHHVVDKSHWRLLYAAFLGWTFDGYEATVLLLVMAPALRQVLAPDQIGDLPRYAGMLIAITLLGWAIGGVVAGILADYIGRRRVMIYTILIYALFTGLTALAGSWWQIGLCRFITGLGLGGEWATGATLVAESWPTRARAKGLGIMQSAFGWGALLAAAVWYFLQPIGGAGAWRYPFLVGALPALIVLFIRRNVDESPKWIERNEQRQQARLRQRAGGSLTNEQAALTKFTVASILQNHVLRRAMMQCLLMSLATTVGYWAVSSWIPSYAETVARDVGEANPGRWSAIVGIVYNCGAIVGYLAGGFLVDIIGRRRVLAAFFGGSILTTPLLYFWADTPTTVVVAAGLNGVFTLGQFVWIAIYPAELFPTAVRATAMSMVFDTSRFISFLGPLVAGMLITKIGGYGETAILFSSLYVVALLVVLFIPETTGKPLPH
jgi:MFS family permease